MSIHTLEEKFTALLDIDAKIAYSNMIKAERDFVNALYGQTLYWHSEDKIFKETPPDNRGRVLKILSQYNKHDFSSQNPNLDQLLNKRDDFKNELSRLISEQGLPNTIGKQSISPPILIYPQENSIVEYELPVNMPKPNKHIDKIEWRTKTAIKSTKLSINEVKILIQDQKNKNEQYKENAKQNSQYKRIPNIENKIDELNKQIKKIKYLMKQYKNENLICHKSSGTGLVLKFKHKKLSYTTSIQHICIIPGYENTIFQQAHKRPNKKSKLELIEQIGPYLIYINPEGK